MTTFAIGAKIEVEAEDGNWYAGKVASLKGKKVGVVYNGEREAFEIPAKFVRMMAEILPVMPAIGDGATYGSGSDSYAATVIKVENGIVTVQDDNHKPTAKNEGPYGNQDYTYSANKKGATKSFKFYPKQDRWVSVYLNPETGKYVKGLGGVHFGHRRYYQDPSF